MRWCALLLLSCSTPPPAQPTPVQSVSVAPQSSGSPNEPTLLLGTPKSQEPSGDIVRVKVKEEPTDPKFTPPKDRCPEGITEMMSTHLRIGESMELAPGANPVTAFGEIADAVEITFDRGKRIVRATARKHALVFLVVERETKCTLYGINGGY